MTGQRASDPRHRLAALRRAGGDPGLAPLSSAQQRMWLADQSVPGLPAYHICRVLRLDGDLDPAALDGALADQVARHEALRTGVLAVDGQPLARVGAPGPFTLPVLEVAGDAAADAWVEAALRRPFPMTGEPLCRAALLRLAPARHRLVLVLHHLVADAWSIEVLLRDLGTAYRVRAAGGVPARQPVPSYRSYVADERASAAGPEGQSRLAYWTRQLRDVPPLELPTDRPRATAPVRHGALIDFSVPAGTADALRRVGRTLTPVLLAAYGVLLHRYSGQDDLVIGLPTAGRDDHRSAGGMGLYVRTLPIRCRFAGNPPFAELAGQVSGTVLEALDAAAVPMERVVQALSPTREVGRNPLFDVAFGVLHDPPPTVELPGLRTAVDRPYSGHAKFDLHLEVIDNGARADLGGRLEYDADLITAGSARTLVDCYLTLLGAIAGDPRRPIGHLPLLPAGAGAPGRPHPDRDAPGGGYLPRPVRVDALFRRVAAGCPDRLALIDPSGVRLTYAELAARVRGVAAALVAYGVAPGDFVGLALPRGIDLVVASLGVLTAGAAYVPLDAGYPAARLETMIADAGVRLVVAAAGSAPAVPVPVVPFPAAPPESTGPADEDRPADAARPADATGPADAARHADATGPADGARLETGPATVPASRDERGDAPAYVMFTSGSTGRAKAVVVTHRGVVRLAQDPPNAAARWMHVAAPVFDAATLEVWTPLLAGGSLLVVPGSPSVADLAALIARHRVEVAFLTTGLFNVVVDEHAEALRPLRQVMTGGDVMSPAHARRALRVVGTVINYYGPTENTTCTTGQRLRAGTDVPDSVPIGRPVRGTTVHVVDRYLQPVPPGVIGEIVTGGDGLALGYAGDPARTAERFIPDPFGASGSRLYRTGDFGWFDREGLLHFSGRRDSQVKVRGFRVELGEIENAAATHPGVRQAAVVAHNDPSGDRRLVGFVAGSVAAEELRSYLAGMLPAYLVPERWVAVDRLPLAVAGKVDRPALARAAARVAAREPAERVAREPTLVEQLLAAWFAELLGAVDAHPGTDFFAAGGHSLLASRLAARIRSTFGVDLPLATVFGNPRLGDLAGAIGAAPRTGTPPLVPAGRHRELPLSYAQERMWFLERYAPGSPLYHVPLHLRLDGPLDPAALREALTAVSDRHAALRTVFGERDGEPYQTILPTGTAPTLAEVDLRGLDTSLREAALAEVAAGAFREPFDPRVQPPLRAVLVAVGDRRHHLILVLHHLIADGWSVPLICHDLAGHYRDAAPARPAELTYPDFAGWQRALLAGPAGERSARYWRDRLAGAPHNLELPGDRPAATVAGATAAGGGAPDRVGTGAAGRTVAGGAGTGAGAGYDGALHRLTLPAELLVPVRAFSRRAGRTVFATMLTAFAVLLARRTGRRDLLIGTPVANRTDAAVADMVGLFVNTLPIRCDLTGDTSFADLVARTSGTVIEALGHAELPFERIVELLEVGRDPGRPPLVQVMFALQPAVPARFRLGGCEAELVPAHHGTAKFDLTLSLFDDGAAMSGFLEYRTDRFSAGYAAGLADELTGLLRRLDPEAAAPLEAGVPAPAPVEATPAPATVDDDPGAGLLRAVGAVWSDVLGVAAAAPDADFFALGGHSLSAVRVIARLRERLGVEVPLRDLFERPTLAAFAARVAVAGTARDRPPLRPRPVTGPVPLAPAQERHWVLYQLDPASPAQNVPVVLRLDGLLDRAALERALTLVSVRHGVLRTTFDLVDGVPAQLVGPPRPVRVPVLPASPETLPGQIAAEADRPFALADQPPWRAALLRVAPDEHYLVLNLHHIITDGWSTGVLLRELAAFYRGGSAALSGGPAGPGGGDAGAGERPVAGGDTCAGGVAGGDAGGNAGYRPAPLAVQYTDYARWQREWAATDAGLDFWRGHLAGVPALDLPSDRPRPAVTGHAGGHHGIRFDAAERAGLERLARQCGGTLFTAVLAVYATALGRYAGQHDFAVGTFHANRGAAATDALIGFFVNNLALRCDLSGDPTWRALIGRLAGTVSAAFEHADTPFERVVEALSPRRSPNRSPLFQAMCVLQNLPDWPDRFGPLAVRYQRQPYQRADFDLTLWLREQDGGELDGGLSYDAEIFDAGTVRRLADLIGALTRSCLDDPDGRVALAARAPTPVPAPPVAAPRRWLPERLAGSPPGHAGAVALSWLAADGTVHRMSHAALRVAANRLAHRLIAAGAGPERRVAVLLDRSPEAVVAFLAILTAGACYVPVDPDYPAARVELLLQLADPDLVVTAPRWAHLAAGRSRPPLLVGVEPAWPATPPAPVPLRGDELAYLIFTSGSTGQPKAVMVSHANLASYLDAIVPAMGLSAGDRVLNFASVSFDACTEELYPALLAGASVVLRPAGLRVPDTSFDGFLAATRPTVLSLPVTFWHAWVQRLAAEQAKVPDHVHTLLLNAEEPGVTRYRQWCAAGGDRVRLVNTYGPTEGTVTATLYRPEHRRAGGGPGWHEVWRRFPIGKPLPHVRTYLLDGSGLAVPEGAAGELCLGGPAVTRGWLGMPGATADAYRPDPSGGVAGARLYRTGDLARRLPDGTLLLLGRADRQVKIRGFRVEPGEVEAALGAHPEVGQVAVLARDAGPVRELVAYLAPQGPPGGDDGLRDWLAERLPEHLVPARLLRLPELPLSPNGKVDRGVLAARLEQDLDEAARRRPGASGPVAPRTAEERILHDAWREVLGTPAFGVRDNFFAVGGDSIRGLLVVNKARAAGLAVTAQDLFTHQTIAELAAAARVAPDATAPPAGEVQPGGTATQPGGPVPVPPVPAPRPAQDPAAPASRLTEQQLRRAMSRLEGGDR